jgi:hypothetical protein
MKAVYIIQSCHPRRRWYEYVWRARTDFETIWTNVYSCWCIIFSRFSSIEIYDLVPNLLSVWRREGPWCECVVWREWKHENETFTWALQIVYFYWPVNSRANCHFENPHTYQTHGGMSSPRDGKNESSKIKHNIIIWLVRVLANFFIFFYLRCIRNVNRGKWERVRRRTAHPSVWLVSTLLFFWRERSLL